MRTGVVVGRAIRIGHEVYAFFRGLAMPGSSGSAIYIVRDNNIHITGMNGMNYVGTETISDDSPNTLCVVRIGQLDSQGGVSYPARQQIWAGTGTGKSTKMPIQCYIGDGRFKDQGPIAQGGVLYHMQPYSKPVQLSISYSRNLALTQYGPYNLRINAHARGVSDQNVSDPNIVMLTPLSHITGYLDGKHHFKSIDVVYIDEIHAYK
jgi:hypothetical protein